MPIPYPNIAMSSDLTKGTTTVKADGGNMCANYGSEFSKSTGDEAGSVGGVASSTFIKEAAWITFSFDVKLEGKAACRLTDKMFHNHRNTVNMAGEIQDPKATKEIDCMAAWAEAEKATKEIAKEEDPIKRNKMISATYAKDYQESPHLQWFGAAAFASKQVGCGMTSAQDASSGTLPKITDKIGITKDSDKLAGATLQKLGDGNKAVFEEMQPAHDFYKKNGIEALKHCASERDPPLPDSVVKGFEQADQGKALGDKALERKGALTMLKQEQLVTLQKSAYDDPLFQQALKTNQEWNESWLPTFGYAQPTKVVFDAACSASGAPFIEQAGGNLGDPKWRMDFATRTTEKFSSLANNQPDVISRALDKIARAGAF